MKNSTSTETLANISELRIKSTSPSANDNAPRLYAVLLSGKYELLLKFIFEGRNTVDIKVKSFSGSTAAFAINSTLDKIIEILIELKLDYIKIDL